MKVISLSFQGRSVRICNRGCTLADNFDCKKGPYLGGSRAPRPLLAQTPPLFLGALHPRSPKEGSGQQVAKPYSFPYCSYADHSCNDGPEPGLHSGLRIADCSTRPQGRRRCKMFAKVGALPKQVAGRHPLRFWGKANANAMPNQS